MAHLEQRPLEWQLRRLVVDRGALEGVVSVRSRVVRLLQDFALDGRAVGPVAFGDVGRLVRGGLESGDALPLPGLRGGLGEGDVFEAGGGLLEERRELDHLAEVCDVAAEVCVPVLEGSLFYPERLGHQRLP